MDISPSFNSRLTAYENYLQFLKSGTFLPKDLAPLARQLAYGAIQRDITLDHLIEPIKPRKLKEKALLKIAIYEAFYLSFPRHATVNYWVEIGKKTTHPTFVKFLNSFLRNLPEKRPLFTDFSLEYSFSAAFIDRVKKTYPENYLSIFDALNEPAKLFARDRINHSFVQVEELAPFLNSQYYIQNPTPFTLIETLSKGLNPETILDLCANPGGKSIALNELFPLATFTINDVKPLYTLKENFTKYNIPATFTSFRGEEFPLDKQYDLVVLDVPCSNSGVLNKRPEARSRLDLTSIIPLQQKLFERAIKLVKPGGALFYLTCSILPEENKTPIKPETELLILPNKETGFDGGYGAKLVTSSFGLSP